MNVNDLREWAQLSPKEQSAARSLGLSCDTWDLKELADLPSTIQTLFGPDFEACVTQGCDVDSIDFALTLAKAHPQVYATFGCHPKGAWTYNEALEKRLLDAYEACGQKALAWGEFGLDYSHNHYSKMGGNRRCQREVFARQLKLAVFRELPMVLHIRGADRDSLRMLRMWVPRPWRMHVHSYRGTVAFMDALLNEFTQAYIGFSGIVTMGDVHVEMLCKRCPLNRIILETDAPYLPLNRTYYSHPGQIPGIAQRVAQLKGCSLQEVLTVTRESCRAVYGI